MGRISWVLSVTAIMAMIIVAMAVPALADKPVHPGQCIFEKGRTHCTEEQVVGGGTQIVNQYSYPRFCGLSIRTVTETTYRPYTDYQITDTTYAGKGPHVVDQTIDQERRYGAPYTITTGGC